jgi:hypothetical protein
LYGAALYFKGSVSTNGVIGSILIALLNGEPYSEFVLTPIELFLA